MARIVPSLQLAKTLNHSYTLHLTSYILHLTGRSRIFLHRALFARHYSLPPRQPSVFARLARWQLYIVHSLSAFRLSKSPLLILRIHVILWASMIIVQSAIQLYLHSRPQSPRSFWPAAGLESSGSNHFEITKEITEFCPFGFTQSASSHA